MIEIEGLSKSFTVRGVKVKVLDNVLLKLDKGVNCLVGPNGSGKTTLIKIIATELPPDEGIVKVEGFDVVMEKEEVRKRIAVVFDSVSVDQDITVEDNLKFFKAISNFKGDIDNLVSEFQLDKYLKFKVSFLSAGNKKKLDLIRAIMLNRPVLLLDEPTNHLDSITAQKVWSLLKDLNKIILVTSHTIPRLQVCDKLFVISKGKIVRYPVSRLIDVIENYRLIEVDNKRLYVKKDEIESVIKRFGSSAKKLEIRELEPMDAIYYLSKISLF
ncbi:ATP-binding cassette domain-containing protein [Acidianus infernus]|uniref:ATP-binding cassette domain-containing protein n=1 Tax=Acidianus infernus TaxID=12915 RepID=A0A6A9QF46_ACIIN|nr:ABC transporter ATP-binding protein [Acidianus infernus]MUM65771.1 ATP-binding cassette domain-containing protein [Acidianus infernus]